MDGIATPSARNDIAKEHQWYPQGAMTGFTLMDGDTIRVPLISIPFGNTSLVTWLKSPLQGWGGGWFSRQISSDW
jgi:hypothetical protein